MNSLSVPSSSGFSATEAMSLHSCKSFDDLLSFVKSDPKDVSLDEILEFLKKISSGSISVDSTIESFEVICKLQGSTESENFIETIKPVLDFIYDNIDFTYEVFIVALIPRLQNNFKNNPCDSVARTCALHALLTSFLFPMSNEALLFQMFFDFSGSNSLVHAASVLKVSVDNFLENDKINAEDFYQFTRIMNTFDLVSQRQITLNHSEKILETMESIGEDPQAPFETIACFVDRFGWMNSLCKKDERDWTVLYNYFIRAAKQVVDVVDKSGIAKLAQVWKKIAEDDDEIIYLGWVGLCFVFSSYNYIFESEGDLITLVNPLKLDEFVNIAGYLLAVCDDFDSFVDKIKGVFRLIKVNFQVWDVALRFLNCHMKTLEKVRLLNSFATKCNLSLSNRLEGIARIFKNAPLEEDITNYASISEGILLSERRIDALFPDGNETLCQEALKICYLWWGVVLVNNYLWKQKNPTKSKIDFKVALVALKNCRLIELASRLTFLRQKLRDDGEKLDELIGNQVLLWENGRYIIVTAKPSPP